MGRVSRVVGSHIIVIAHDKENDGQSKNSNSDKHHMIGFHCENLNEKLKG